jgi:flavodoxin
MRQILIVYYSRTGVTRNVAERISRRTGAEAIAIRDVRSRDGVLGYVRSAMEAMHGTLPGIQLPPLHLADYDLVILMAPVWAGHVASPMRRFVHDHARELRHVAFCCTMGGSGAEGALADVRKLLGFELEATCALTDHEVFHDDCEQALSRFVAQIGGAPETVAVRRAQTAPSPSVRT